MNEFDIASYQVPEGANSTPFAVPFSRPGWHLARGAGPSGLYTRQLYIPPMGGRFAGLGRWGPGGSSNQSFLDLYFRGGERRVVWVWGVGPSQGGKMVKVKKAANGSADVWPSPTAFLFIISDPHRRCRQPTSPRPLPSEPRHQPSSFSDHAPCNPFVSKLWFIKFCIFVFVIGKKMMND